MLNSKILFFVGLLVVLPLKFIFVKWDFYYQYLSLEAAECVKQSIIFEILTVMSSTHKGYLVFAWIPQLSEMIVQHPHPSTWSHRSSCSEWGVVARYHVWYKHVYAA